MPLDVLKKEEISTEKRFWLRTTKRCNNHCIFCHDSEIQDGKIIETSLLKKEIYRAAGEGYSRLILSGGEPTIHPHLIELIGYARDCGFKWIQIISNGRMFAYPVFTRRAIEAGLSEVTISLHSHIERISEQITDINGSFRQTLTGIENLKKYNIVLSIDIVLNKLNISHLKDTIEFFFKRYNITEFDLLHLTPFGRAFENYELLKLEAEEEQRGLRKAIRFAKANNIVLWTNRVPPPILEGYEEYIQDPHKIKDEIKGRYEIFENYLKGGTLICRNINRCNDCFVKTFCDFLVDIKSRFTKGRIERLEITGDISQRTIRSLFDHITYNAAILTPPKFIDSIESEIKDSAKRLVLKIDDIDGISDVLKRFKIDFIVSDNPEIVKISGVKKRLILNNRNIEILKNLKGFRLELIYPNAETLKKAFESIPEISKIKQLMKGHGFIISNLPRCISGQGFREHFYYFKSDFIREEGFDIERITDDFLLNKNYYKSLRCTDCIYYTQCQGLHINHIRREGFRVLRPIKEI